MKIMKIALPVAASVAALGLAAPANAVLNVPLPSNAYITLGGLQWAWAIPLPASSFPNALSYQGGQGWRLPTAAELAAAPNATDFLFAGGNTPFAATGADGSVFQATNAAYNNAQSAGACASPYFNTGFNHCDWQDGNGQTFEPWAGLPGAQSFADQLFVRDAVPAIPEPTTWALLILGFGLVGASMRRRQQTTRVSFA